MLPLYLPWSVELLPRDEGGPQHCFLCNSLGTVIASFNDASVADSVALRVNLHDELFKQLENAEDQIVDLVESVEKAEKEVERLDKKLQEYQSA